VQQDREEMEVLFTFLSERYERKSLMITSNLVFSEWDKIFKDPRPQRPLTGLGITRSSWSWTTKATEPSRLATDRKRHNDAA
jgi:DNA replication protein DnaC